VRFQQSTLDGTHFAVEELRLEPLRVGAKTEDAQNRRRRWCGEDRRLRRVIDVLFGRGGAQAAKVRTESLRPPSILSYESCRPRRLIRGLGIGSRILVVLAEEDGEPFLEYRAGVVEVWKQGSRTCASLHARFDEVSKEPAANGFGTKARPLRRAPEETVW